jgi:hypothetical protein
MTVLCVLIIIILISYITIYYIIIKLLIMENHPSQNWKQNSPAILFFLVMQVPGRGPEQIESCKTVLYLLIITIILISYVIIYYYYNIKLLIKRRTISAETGNGNHAIL